MLHSGLLVAKRLGGTPKSRCSTPHEGQLLGDVLNRRKLFRMTSKVLVRRLQDGAPVLLPVIELKTLSAEPALVAPYHDA